jgi:hypothetical protein
MLQSYFPIYQLALDLQRWRWKAEVHKGSAASKSDVQAFHAFLETIHQRCLEYGFIDTSEMAKRVIIRPQSYAGPETYTEIFSDVNHINGSLGYELEKEAVFRIPPERKKFYEQNDLFGPKVADAFPSCARDIRMAGNCYAFGQGDACVHHLMMVLERGLNVLAAKLDVPYERTNWQNIIEKNASKLKLRGPDFDFHREANSQFGFLKDTYRNHSEHARDDPYDVPEARSILDHVSDFMQALAKGGLSE